MSLHPTITFGIYRINSKLFSIAFKTIHWKTKKVTLATTAPLENLLYFAIIHKSHLLIFLFGHASLSLLVSLTCSFFFLSSYNLFIVFVLMHLNLWSLWDYFLYTSQHVFKFFYVICIPIYHFPSHFLISSLRLETMSY